MRPVVDRERIVGIVSGAASSVLASAVLSAVASWSPPSPAALDAEPVAAVGALVPGPESAPVEPAPAVLSPAAAEALHRDVLARSASRLSAPADVHQAQMWAESRYDCEAESPAGAKGCAQFMPRTWAGDVRPRLGGECADAEPTDPECAMQGQIEYMDLMGRWLSVPADLGVRLAAYNAGVGNVNEEQSACAMLPGCDPSVWSGSLEAVCLRGPAACGETRAYVPAILKAASAFRDRRVDVTIGW